MTRASRIAFTGLLRSTASSERSVMNTAAILASIVIAAWVLANGRVLPVALEWTAEGPMSAIIEIAIALFTRWPSSAP